MSRANDESRERERQYKKATYDYCKSKGICVICQREPAFYNHVRCPSCMEKSAQQKANRTANMTQEQRNKINQQKRERYHRLKEAGMCVNCGTQKAQHGKVTCIRCDIQGKRASAAYRERNGKKKGFREAGTCSWCGSERAEGYKLCPSCLVRNRKLMAYARQFANRDRYWET